MFQGLTNNNSKTVSFAPDTVLTISDGQFVYRDANTVPHPFGRFSGELVYAVCEEEIGRVSLGFVASSGRKVMVMLPPAGGQTLRLLLPLAAVRAYRGRYLGIDVKPEMKNGKIRADVSVYDGNEKVSWTLAAEDAPKDKEGVAALVSSLISDINAKLSHESNDKSGGRVAPDIDDVPEGL